ncbi:formyl transferase [Acinetobacter haemolyticus]|nr:formyl transferase [Acinetobacter haemolyticus]
MTKVMIVGQKWLAEQLVEYCIENQIHVVAVAAPSMNDRLAIAANRFDIPVRIAPVQLDSNDVPNDTDLILCAHAHCYVTTEARKKSLLGALGYHPSLLPAYRGKNAIQAALDNHELMTGGSLYWLDDGWDTGAVFMQQSCQIKFSNARDLWVKQLAPLGLKLFAAGLQSLKGTHSI